MSITRIYGAVVFTCDNCEDTLETGEKQFDAAIAVSKQAGWSAIKVDGSWNHLCEDCKESK